MYMMKLDASFFDKMKARKKIYEVRLYDEKRQSVSVGDKIIFKRRPELIEGLVVRVTEIRRFESFEQMAKTLSLTSVGFDNKNAEEVSQFYRTIYTQEDEQKYGVVAFRVELI